MNTKNMTVEEAQRQIELLTKRIEFNNKLNAFVRKFRKQYKIGNCFDDKAEVKFNGYWDKPTDEMVVALTEILMKDSIMDMSWMDMALKKEYARSISAIFGQVYSPAVNTYVLNDLHDCEKFIKLHTKAEEKKEETNSLFTVERDLDGNRMNIMFDSIPSSEVRERLKANGFKWSPKMSVWTRQLTDQAEMSLERLKKELADFID